MMPPLIPSFVRQHLHVALHGANTFASDVTVCWTEISGGTTDPGTGGNLDGLEVFLSGSMRAYGYEAEPKNEVRKFAEIAAGDLILDLDPNPQVALFAGQILSGSQPLDDLANKGLRYVWNGRYYTSKDVSPDLQSAWDAFLGNRRQHRTLLLKRST